MPTPLLLFSDSASASSGLARITRDLAVRIAQHLPEFRVATIGYGASGSSKLPFPQYSWTFNNDWIIHDLPEVWDDFSRGEPGIFMSIQDASRMLAFARPDWCPDQRVANFLKKQPFKKWGYFPIDANGPNGKLSKILGDCILGYDRALAYTKWAEKIVYNTIGQAASNERQLTHLPHGIDTSVFYPRDRQESRKMFGWLTAGQEIPIEDGTALIGIVATNQIRKDYGQAFQVYAELSRQRKCVLWIHTDSIDRHWSLPYLITDFGVQNIVITHQEISDDNMARLYSACDVTLGIGLGEGYGYCQFESMACGTPVVHGHYGGSVEFLPKDQLVPVWSYRTEGIFASTRPVFRTEDWVKVIQYVLNKRKGGHEFSLTPELHWGNLWQRWSEWFQTGVSTETGEKECASQQV